MVRFPSTPQEGATQQQARVDASNVDGTHRLHGPEKNMQDGLRREAPTSGVEFQELAEGLRRLSVVCFEWIRQIQRRAAEYAASEEGRASGEKWRRIMENIQAHAASERAPIYLPAYYIDEPERREPAIEVVEAITAPGNGEEKN